MHLGAPVGQWYKVARHSWSLRDVRVDGATAILSGTLRIGSFPNSGPPRGL